VRTISANGYKKPFMITGPAVGWVGETAARPQTDTSVLDQLSFPAMELYAMPADIGTRTGNFVPDHQPPNALNQFGRSQRLYPQCVSCSDFQGGWIRSNRGAR
jgi:Phage capsid family